MDFFNNNTRGGKAQVEKFIATIIVAVQKFCGLFDDDEPFDAEWMDAKAWRETRI